jgi:hypothetical protein
MYYSRRHQERVEARDLKVFQRLFIFQVILLVLIMSSFIAVCIADGAALRIGAM